MDRLDVMQLFVRIAETGSFSRAARAAGVGQPTASKRIAGLEARLGAQLLQRTSRGLSLTDAGQSYYEVSVRLLGEIEAAEVLGRTRPNGALRPVARRPVRGIWPHVSRAAPARILRSLPRPRRRSRRFGAPR